MKIKGLCWRHGLSLLLGLCVMALAPAAHAVTITWDGSSNGSWHTAANWDLNRVPGAGDDVVIPDLAGTASVTHNSGTTSINSLTCSEVLILSGGTLNLAAASTISGTSTFSGGSIDGAGNLTISGPFTWSIGTMQGTGTTTISPGVNWSLPMIGAVSLVRTLNNEGVAFQSGSAQFAITAPGILRNRAGATLDWRGTSTLVGTGTLENQAGALLKRTTSSGTTVWSVATFIGAGNLSLEAGTLEIDCSSALFTGPVTALAGTTLNLDAGTHLFNPGATLSVAGTLGNTFGNTTIDPAVPLSLTGTLELSRGTLTIGPNVTIPAFNLTSIGVLDGPGNVTVTSGFSWNGGTMQGSGTTTIGAGVNWTMPLNGLATTLTRTFNNDGAGIQTGTVTLTITTPGVLRNRSGATLDWRGTSIIGGTGTLENQAGALLKRTTSSGTTVWSVATFIGAGTLSLEAGTLELDSSSATFTGSVTALTGTTLNLDAGTHLFNPGATLSVAGTLGNTFGNTTIDPAVPLSLTGTLELSRGTLTIGPNVTIPTFNLTSIGVLDGPGHVTVTSGFSWLSGSMQGSGTTTIAAGVNWTMPLNGLSTTLARTFNNDGAGIQTGTITLNITTPGVLRNRAGATLDWRGTSTIGGTGTLENQAGALLIKSVSAGTAQISTAFTNNGTLRVLAGTLRSSGAFSNFAAQTLTGGSYEITGTFMFTGADVRTNAATILLDGPAAALVDPSSANGLAALTTNNAGASLTVKNGKALASSALLVNNGTVVLGPGAGSSLTANTGYRQNAGLTTLSGGALASSAFVELLGGTLNGSGTVTGNLTNAATVAAGTSPGAITVSGNYTQQAAGHLVAEVGGAASGTQFDALTVGGTATLGGDLNASLINGFLPGPGQTFAILTAATRTGTFATDNLPIPSGANCVDVSYVAGAARIECFQAVAISANPTNQTVCAPGPASFSVTATGTGLAFQWRKNGADIGGATSSTFSILSTSAGDAGSYDCMVSNACGSATSAAASLTVNIQSAITSHPASQSVCTGSSVTFTVVATGTNLTYQWRKVAAIIPGATSSSYTIPSVVAGDAGSYNCVVQNVPCNTISSNGATLTVSAGLAITQQPQNQSGCLGGTVTLTVVVSGASPTYQWRKAAVDIGGATAASLVLTNLTAADMNSYDVVITGSCGTLTSASATVTVQDCPATVFVNAAAPAGGNGQSWGTAFNNLQTALGSVGGTLNTREIWVAAGTYRPDAADRAASFQLRNNVQIYGGFVGGETSRSQRNPAAHPTILSGDLAGDDGPSFAGNGENSLHVVNGDAVDLTAVLDGFTIRGGNANTTGTGTTGGGMTISANGRPTVVNCTFQSNNGAVSGGAVSVSASSPQFNGCTFAANRAPQGGGLFMSGAGTPALTGCAFNQNTATTGGAALFNNLGTGIVATGCSFTGNTLSNPTGNLSGGALALTGGQATLTDCNFTSNAIVQTAAATTRPGGGAVSIGSAAVATLTRCLFVGNSCTSPSGATLGGAVRVISATANLTGCRFHGNTVNAGAVGPSLGGAVAYGFAGAGGVVTNCVFSGNSVVHNGGAVNVTTDASVAFRNATFSANSAGASGGGLFVGTTIAPDLDNCVFWGNGVGASTNEAAQISVVPTGATAPTVDYCIVQGLTGALGGTANSGADPIFADADGADNTVGTADDDLAPGPNSPAVDSGNNAQVPGGVVTDAAGLPRFVNDPCVNDTGAGTPPLVDRGAYERQLTSCTTGVRETPTVDAHPLLGAPTPNPTPRGLTVALALPTGGPVRIDVVDTAGRRVALLLDAELAAGESTVAWDGLTAAGERAAAGIYFIRVATAAGSAARKVLVLP